MLERVKKNLLGDRAFYRTVVVLLLPLVIQQGITNVVNLLDNVMVGRLGTEAISGVAIVNQLIFVFNLTVFGAVSGASIFGAQFAGNRDWDGLRQSFRFKLLIGTLISVVAITLFVLYGDVLINLYLSKENSSPEALALTMSEAKDYLAIVLWVLPPFMLVQCLASTLRETGETLSPMLAGILSLLINLCLNYVLIYGKLGFPAYGVRGAAYATVIARYMEFGALLIYVLVKKAKFFYMRGALTSLYIPKALFKKICITGAPLLMNELLWSMGTALINQCYSVRGLDAVAASSITTTVWSVFAIIMFSMGSAVSIMVGQKLGMGDIEGAKAVDRKLLFLDVAVHVGIGLIVILASHAIPQIYNTSDAVRAVTSQMLVVAGISLPFHALVHATYFTIRSGGRTGITFLFDCVYTWVIALPLAFVLSRYTTLSVVWMYVCLQCADALKICIALPLLNSGIWAKNLISDTNTAEPPKQERD